MRNPIKYGGVTVPYTAMWTAENERRQPSIVREKWGGQYMDMLSEGITALEGKPLFAMLHVDRCREVVREGLCQMCVGPLPKQVYAINQGRMHENRPHLTDGLPMCLDCVLEALNACPGMHKQIEAGWPPRFFSCPRGAWLYVPSLVGADSEHENVNRVVRDNRGPVCGGMGMALTSWKRVEPVTTKTGYILRAA